MSETLHFHKDKALLSLLFAEMFLGGWLHCQPVVETAHGWWSCQCQFRGTEPEVVGQEPVLPKKSIEKQCFHMVSSHGLPMNSFPDMLSDDICAGLLFLLPVPTLCFGS